MLVYPLANKKGSALVRRMDISAMSAASAKQEQGPVRTVQMPIQSLQMGLKAAEGRIVLHSMLKTGEYQM